MNGHIEDKRSLTWDTFTEIANGRGAGIWVSILIGKYAFSFGANFIRSLETKPTHVIFRYAEGVATRYIGFSFVQEGTKGAKPIHFSKEVNKEDYGIVKCARFFKKYGVDTIRNAGRYELEAVDSKSVGRVYVIELEK